MKNIITFLAFAFTFTFTAEAQKKRTKKHPKLSVEQHANLAIKKMTLALDLSKKQQNQIRPILVSKIAEKKAVMEKRKEARKNKKKPTADEIYAMKSKQLDNQILMKNKMKNILNKEQFEKFDKMQKKRNMIAMKKWKSRKEKMKRKRIKERKNIEEGK